MSLEFVSKLLLYYFIFSGILYFLADYAMFPVPKSSYVDSYNILKLNTKDGKKISAIYLPNPKAKYTILFSHGNGEDLGSISLFLKTYQQKGFSVFSFDYHGYGTSQGQPSEKNTYLDIEAAYLYLTQNLNILPDHIILHGRSLGTGPVIELGTRTPIKAVILESAMLSAFRILTYIPLFPFDKFRNYQKISALKVPILFIHGTKDKVIPFWHGQNLYKMSTASKYFFRVEGAGHNDIQLIAGDSYWNAIIEFVQKVGCAK